MTCKKNLKKAALAISLAVVPSIAMEADKTSDSPNKIRRGSVPAVLTGSGQNSPRSLALSSPRNSGILSLNRSGSNSDIAIAAVATATLQRVVTPDKLATLKKRTSSVGCLISPRAQKTSVEKPTSEEKLADLRSSLDRSKSPLENGEASLAYGEQDLQEAMMKLEGLKTPRNSVMEDGSWTPRNSAVEDFNKESEKEEFENLFGE